MSKNIIYINIQHVFIRYTKLPEVTRKRQTKVMFITPVYMNEIKIFNVNHVTRVGVDRWKQMIVTIFRP